ncbi:MAG: Lrp/AsnC family transcriptional regulator [Betaproteobacteria bacterium]|nr:Lrp/AsnC family transcriptional regulator [Betaproteobacteria bacterium]
MDETDRRIVNALQDGFPVCEHAFAQAAAGLGLAKEDLIQRIARMLEAGELTRFGPMYNADRMGGAFTLCAMAVPADDFERVAAIVNAYPEVAHNYEREHSLNMWFVLAAAKPGRIAEVVRDIERRAGWTVLQFPKLDEYFVELKFAL